MPDASPLVAALAHAAEPWRELYDRSRAVSVGVMFAHLAALVVAGGFALSADRGTLAAARDPERRARHLEALAAAHPVVGAALGVVLASGALLALADVETFATMGVFWLKLALVTALLGNGLLMRRTERTLRAPDPADADVSAAWRRLRLAAGASAALWLAVVLAGTVLAES